MALNDDNDFGTADSSILEGLKNQPKPLMILADNGLSAVKEKTLPAEKLQNIKPESTFIATVDKGVKKITSLKTIEQQLAGNEGLNQGFANRIQAACESFFETVAPGNSFTSTISKVNYKGSLSFLKTQIGLEEQQLIKSYTTLLGTPLDDAGAVLEGLKSVYIPTLRDTMKDSVVAAQQLRGTIKNKKDVVFYAGENLLNIATVDISTVDMSECKTIKGGFIEYAYEGMRECLADPFFKDVFCSIINNQPIPELGYESDEKIKYYTQPVSLIDVIEVYYNESRLQNLIDVLYTKAETALGDLTRLTIEAQSLLDKKQEVYSLIAEFSKELQKIFASIVRVSSIVNSCIVFNLASREILTYVTSLD